MRLIKTFLLHLYVDSEAPERICGKVRPLEDLESYSFKSDTQLEALLRRLVTQRSNPQTPPPEADICPEK